MKIALRKTSLIDYPGRVSSVIFFPGCNLRCPWCHNGDLVLDNETGGLITLEDGLTLIRKRQPVLGGVVLSGGEPCLWEELPDIIEEIKKFPLPVKVDTNGMFPAMLEKLLNREETRPAYIALDLKIAPARYGELTVPEKIINHRGTQSSTEKSEKPITDSIKLLCGKEMGDMLVQSADLVRASGIAHEYRTLALPGSFITERDIEALAPLADSAPWYFRPFRGGNCLDPAWNSLEERAGDSHVRLKVLAGRARELGKNAQIP